jgi:hypothetical protein
MPQYAPLPPQMQAQAGVPAQGYDWTVALILSILLIVSAFATAL